MNLTTRFVPNIGLITVLALTIRIVCATWTGLTADECNGTMIAVSGSWAEMYNHLRLDGNAPVFYVILRQYSQIFGYHGFALRCLAIALGTLDVPITYFLFRQILPRPFCLSLALLLACCPTCVLFGTMIRPYAIVAVLGVVSTMTCIATLSKRANVRHTIAYGVSTALLVCTHYWGALIAIGHVGLVVSGLCFGWFGRRQFLYWLAGAVLAFLLFLPQLIPAYEISHGIGSGGSAFDSAPRPTTLINEFMPRLLFNPGFTNGSLIKPAIFSCYFLVFLGFFVPGAMIAKQAEESQSAEITYDGRMWKAATVSGLIAAFCVDFFLPTMRYRYLLPFIPMVFIVYITGINTLLSKKSKVLRLVLPCLVWFVLFIPFLCALPSHPETTIESVVQEIEEKCDRKKDAVVVGWELISPVINFYLPTDIESISYPHLDRSPFFRWTDIAPLIRRPEALQQLFVKLQAILDRGGKIWLIDTAHQTLPLDYRNNNLILNCPFLEGFMRRTDQIRSWLITHSKQIGRTEMAPGSDNNIILSVFAPVGDDPEAKALLPKPDSLWNSMIPDEHSFERTVVVNRHGPKTNSGEERK